MLGCYDFCGHYDWTFEWLRRQGGEALVRRFWDEAIHGDSQRHASELIKAQGFAGMRRYWDHTLTEEGAGFTASEGKGVFRIDMHECPSKGFLVRNGLEQYPDYCDHCIGWIGPMMREAGFVIDHEHNHCGQCWWEFRKMTDARCAGASGVDDPSRDVRLLPAWGSGSMHTFRSATPAAFRDSGGQNHAVHGKFKTEIQNNEIGIDCAEAEMEWNLTSRGEGVRNFTDTKEKN